jgi:hypothetical protein
VSVLLIERRTDAFGEYEERWMVEPPAEGAQYRVTDERWSDDYSVRTIRAWEPTAVTDARHSAEPWQQLPSGLPVAALPQGLLTELCRGSLRVPINFVAAHNQRQLVRLLEVEARRRGGERAGCAMLFLSKCFRCPHLRAYARGTEIEVEWYCYAAFV